MSISSMNRNIIFITFILIAAGTGYLFLNSDQTLKGNREVQTGAKSQEEAPPVGQAPEQDLSVDKKRRARMRAEYAELELARDSVRRQLGKLRTRVWKLQLPPDQARVITKQMQRGYFVLKNPPMRGAFSSVGDISKETTRIKAIGNKLTTLEITIQEYITARDTN